MKLSTKSKFLFLFAMVAVVCFGFAAVHKTEAAGNLTDAGFFGVWNGSAWTTEGKLNYAYNGGVLSAVEAEVKSGNYAGAKTELLNYFKNRTSRTVMPINTGDNPVVDMAGNMTFIGAQADTLAGEITMGNAYVTASVNVLATVDATLGKTNAVGFMIMDKNKEAGLAYIHSRERSNNKPRLEVVIGGVTYTVNASKDTYIEGNNASNFGTSNILAVKGSGIPYNNLERRAYLAFDLSGLPQGTAPTSATLKLYGRNESQTGNKTLYVFNTNDTTWSETDMNWTNVTGNIYSWKTAPGGTTWDAPDYAEINYVSVLSRFYFAAPLAYEHSLNPGETYYSGILVNLMTDFLNDKAAGYPQTIDTGIRAANWVTAYHYMKNSTVMTASDNADILKFLWQEADFLSRPENYQRLHNWGIIQTLGLFEIAVYFPEFARSPQWTNISDSRFMFSMNVEIYEDGSFAESTDTYANVVLSLLYQAKKFGDLNGYSFKSHFDKTLSNFPYFLMNLSAPDGSGPVFGDSDVSNRRAAVYNMGMLYNDNVLKYFGSAGSVGTAPVHTSIFYPDSKVAYMRTGWNSSDLYLFFNNSVPYGHGHPDLLSVVLYAYDRQLLIDPGRYSYTPGAISDWLRLSTEAHNTIEINDTAMNRNTSVKEISNWKTNQGFDFIEGYNQAYEGFTNYRDILFVKPGYWIVSDTVKSTSGAHNYDQLWHFPPNANLSIDPSTKKASTAFVSGANLQVVPADSSGLTATLRDGYYSPGYGIAVDAEYVAIEKNGVSGTATFDTVLYPTEEGNNRNVTVTRLATSPAVNPDTATALMVNLDDGGNGDVGYYYLSKEDNPSTARNFDSFNFNGKLAYVQTDSADALQEAAVVDGRTLQRSGVDLIDSHSAIPDIHVRWNGTTLEIGGNQLTASQDTANGIAIYAPSSTSVNLNGVGVPFTRIGDYIYAVELAAGQKMVYEEAPRINAVASSTLSNWPVVNARDDNAATSWSSSLTAEYGSEWIYIDMGANYDIKRVKLVPRTSGRRGVCFPVDFKLQTSSDATTWTDVPELSLIEYPGPIDNEGEVFEFLTAVNARYVRVLATRFAGDNYGNHYMQLAGIHAYYETTQASGYRATASSTHNATTMNANHVIDGRRDTFWSSTVQAQTGSQWISLDLGGKFGANRIKLVPRGGLKGFPVDFKLQSSMDGVNWTDIAGQSYTGYTATQPTGEWFTFSSTVQARYFRVLGTKFSTDGTLYYMQFAEIAAY